MKGLAIALVLGWLGSVSTAQEAGAPPRRIYVLHSGLHFVLSNPHKNAAAENLKRQLLSRGVPAEDMVVLDSPYPAASWRSALPRDGLVMYLESTAPGSRVAQDAYLRMHQALLARGVTGRDAIVWVGHSAGGQMGLTMAHLAHDLARHPELARQASPYRFEMVVTLGSGIGLRSAPEGVKVRHYYSSADRVVDLLSKHGTVLSTRLGHAVRFHPWCEAAPEAKVRVFTGVNHHFWTRSDAVIDAILNETRAVRPDWRRARPGTPAPVSLAQLLAEAVECEGRVSLEDPPAR